MEVGAQSALRGKLPEEEFLELLSLMLFKESQVATLIEPSLTDVVLPSNTEGALDIGAEGVYHKGDILLEQLPLERLRVG